MFHLITLLSSLLWRRPVVNMNVSDIHSDDAATGKGQSVTEEAVVASTSHSHSLSPADVSGSSVDSASKSEDNFADLSDSKKEKDIEILEVEEDSEPCFIDLTTLLPQEEKKIEDDICITKVIHNKGPLAELMAKRKKNKNRKSESKETVPSSTAGSPDIFLKDLVRRSREYAEKRIRSRSRSRRSSEKRHYSTISDVLSDKQCCEQEVQIDENSNLGPLSRSGSPLPSTTDERQCDNLTLSSTYKRKKEPCEELFEDYRAGCYKKSTYSETATQPRGKRKKRSSSVEEDVVIVSDVSSSSSEENSPCTSRRKKQKQTFTRGWEWSDFGVEHRQKQNEYPGMEFSIMSYNLLAQDLLELHPHLYTHSNWELLDWEYRRARLLEEIDQHLPDILCFQEVQCDHYEGFLTPKLEARGYLGIYCKKSGCQTDGCATFFNVMKFELLNFRQVFYQKGEVLDRANVGLIVGLKPKASIPSLDNSQLYVANTHLLFNPKRGDVKLAQLILFLAELDKAAYKCHKSSNKIVYHPTILCGDFNLEPFCRIYELIVSRYMRYEGLLIRTLAGTSEDHYGRDYHLTKDFFPSYLDITNFCQFGETVKERNLKEATKLLKESSPTHKDPSSENTKENPSDSAVPENSRLSPPPSNEISPPPGLEEMLTPLNSGEVSHFFNFVSTYEHEIRSRRHRRMEVTSYHNLACGTMDYIFYSVDKKPKKSRRLSGGGSSVPEGRLKLLRRYQLFSTDEVRKMNKLPNAELGSDHFSLLAHFLLT